MTDKEQDDDNLIDEYSTIWLRTPMMVKKDNKVTIVQGMAKLKDSETLVYIGLHGQNLWKVIKA